MSESIWTPLNIFLVLLFVITLVLVLLSKTSNFIVPPRPLPPGRFPRPPVQGDMSSFVGAAGPRLGSTVVIPTAAAAPGAAPSKETACDLLWNRTPIAKGDRCCSLRTNVQCAWDTVTDTQMTCQNVSSNTERAFVCLPGDNNPRAKGSTVIGLSLDPGMNPPSAAVPVLARSPLAMAKSTGPSPTPSAVPSSTPALPSVPVVAKKIAAAPVVSPKPASPAVTPAPPVARPRLPFIPGKTPPAAPKPAAPAVTPASRPPVFPSTEQAIASRLAALKAR